MSDCPKCEKCGDEIMGGASIWCCRYATACPMWPHSDGSPAGDGAELLMAKLWMGNALDQIGLQIEDRKRLADALATVADLTDIATALEDHEIVSRVRIVAGVALRGTEGGQLEK